LGFKEFAMNSNKKNDQVNKKPDMLQEPKVIYGTQGSPAFDSSEKSDAILEKLILKSIQDSNEGKGISHEEMMQKVKIKYPFLK
jgi:hypothetical protein